MKTSQLDTWSTREQLALVSAVQSSGDQNWVAVSRSIRLLSNEGPRPQDWYNQKNCALQYANLLETVTPAKRKRDKDKFNGPTTADTNSAETPGEMLAKMLTKQHLDELSVVMEKEKQLYHQLRRELQQLEAGHLDHQLELLWEQMVQEEKDDQEQEQKYEAWAKERENTIAAIQLALRPFKGAVGRRSGGRGSSGAADDSPALPSPVSAAPIAANGNRDDTRSGSGATPSSPLLSSLLTRTAPSHTPPPPQDAAGGSSKGGSLAQSGVVQKLFSSPDGDMKVAPRSTAAAASPTLSRLLELPPSVPGHVSDISSTKSRVEGASEERPTDVKATADVGDDKAAVAAAVNGLPTVKLEQGEEACTKTEPVDISSMVIKEDPLIIVNKPETECLQSSFAAPGGGTSKEGYQDSVSSPTIPKQEVKDVWEEDDDLKGCGEVLQLGEVQRKYSRLSHTSKYHHLFPDEPSPSVKLEKESEEEEDVEEEEEEDEGFAGFGPCSLSVGSRAIGSVLAADGEEEEEEKQPPEREEEEDVYNIDNDDTIGLKASKQQKLRETAPPKLLQESSEVSSSSNSGSMTGMLKTEPVVVLGSPVSVPGPSIATTTMTNTTTAAPTSTVADAEDDSPPAAAAAAKKESGRKGSRRPRDKCDDKTFDFDDCDSVDSLATTSSMCGGDSDTGGGGLGSCSSGGGGGRGSKRKLHPSSDSIFGSSALGSPHNFSDASPESPASANYGDDLESEKALRSWRKSIMILYNEIAAHKFASVFLRPITEEKVPGYHSVVLRPMDLHTIKRNIESGVIRTTEEFQRDIMLMCINAITYNTKGHNIHDMATSLMSDALAKIEEFQSAAGVVAPESPHKTLRRETRESLAKRSEDSSTSARPSKKKKQS